MLLPPALLFSCSTALVFLRVLSACYVVSVKGVVAALVDGEEVITCILLFDRRRGAARSFFRNAGNRPNSVTGGNAQDTNGRVPFVIKDGSFPNGGYRCCFLVLNVLVDG